MKRASGQTLKVAVYSTAAGSVAATAAAAMQWAVLGLLHEFDQDTVPGLLNVAAYTAYLLWVSLFALVAYLIVMIAAGLPLLFLAARMGMRGPLAATTLGALVLTTIVTAILAATTANRISDLVFIGSQQILPGAAAGLAVWIVTRKAVAPRLARPS
ncbi:MAG: hypothetical protein U1E18_03345 [Brevundimonas sp.]|uniref:hypothetical protein n=1 Tax=Brevundimonas sp. TaxID=1871086 RepID=UPI002AB8EA7F|nr:hypothetical protein [Brevundimonas sp.]MDZ4108616.1 hypothetical protein [Brevundimonas sp.]